jgi:hypothetical protein
MMMIMMIMLLGSAGAAYYFVTNAAEPEDKDKKTKSFYDDAADTKQQQTTETKSQEEAKTEGKGATFPEVYAVRGETGEYAARSTFDPIVSKLGGRMATRAELDAAQAKGAEWCSSGYLADGPNAWPRQTELKGCGAPPIAVWTPPTGFGVATVFGIKPAKDSELSKQYKIEPFNSTKWSASD